MSPSIKRWLALAIKLAIVALVVWFVRGAMAKAWQQAHRVELHWQFGWLGAAALFYLASLVPAGYYWQLVLRAMGQDARFAPTLRAYCIGHLGKYVPGKAMVVILRASAVRSERVHGGLAAAGVFVETLTMMAVGAVLGATVVAFRLRDRPIYFWGTLAIAAVMTIPIFPPIFRRLTLAARVGRSDPLIAEKIGGLRWRTLVVGWPLMTVAWLLMGLSLWAALRGIGVDSISPIDKLPELTATAALSLVIGFLSMIPGGLVVREAVLLELMPRLLGVDKALSAVATGLLRLTWLLAELAISAILYPMGPRRPKSEKVAAPANGPAPTESSY